MRAHLGTCEPAVLLVVQTNWADLLVTYNLQRLWSGAIVDHDFMAVEHGCRVSRPL